MKYLFEKFVYNEKQNNNSFLKAGTSSLFEQSNGALILSGTFKIDITTGEYSTRKQI